MFVTVAELFEDQDNYSIQDKRKYNKLASYVYLVNLHPLTDVQTQYFHKLTFFTKGDYFNRYKEYDKELKVYNDLNPVPCKITLKCGGVSNVDGLCSQETLS